MGVRIRRPTDRTCERCGRSERWDTEAGSWQVVRADDGPQVGNLFCLHEWDINGTFSPIEC